MASNNLSTNLMLEGKKPLCYSLQNAHLQQSLPFADEEISNYKSKVLYLIKSQQNSNMSNTKPLDYIQSLKIPETPFINSQKFQKQLKRVQQKINNPSSESKKKNKSITIAQIDKQKLVKNKLNIKQLRENSQAIDKSIVSVESQKNKNANLQISKFFHPDLMKDMIQNLEKQKRIISERIQRQKQDIEEINQQRKYQQLQASQRQSTVQERIKVMVHKKRKID